MQECFVKSKSREPLWRTLIFNKSVGTSPVVAPDAYETEYLQLLRSPGNAACLDQDAIAAKFYPRALKTRLLGRAFFTTTNGLVGVGLARVRRGDEVTIWCGARVPFLIRKCEEQLGYCNLVGPAYVSGIMDGTMLSDLRKAGVSPSTLLVR